MRSKPWFVALISEARVSGARASGARAGRAGPPAFARCAAVALLIGPMIACGPDPDGVVRRLEAAFQSRDVRQMRPWIDDTYGDPLGGRDTLLADLEEMDRSFPRWEVQWPAARASNETSARVATVDTRLAAELVGQPVWKLEGPMPIELRRTDRWRVVTGVLSDFRDVRRLMQARRAALEANDVEGLASTLHPQYRDGVIDRTEAVRRLERDIPGRRLRMTATHYRLEVRRDLAHLDEHYWLTVDGTRGPPSVIGLTLKKSAGRWRIAAGLYRK